MDNIIEIQGLKMTYSKPIIDLGGRKAKEVFYVINNLELSIQKGKVTALLGGNGSGKTTLFNMLCGYLKPDFGEINYFNGKGKIDITKLKPHQIAQKGIGRMFQGTHIFKNLSVLDNLLIADDVTTGESPFLYLIKQRQTRKLEAKRATEAEEVLEKLLGKANPIWEKREQLAGSLSYGQQRLLALARLFMNDNLELVMLDEPCAGVNPDVANLIINIIKKLTEDGKSVFLIEHNLRFVEQVADYCYYLKQGEIEAAGSFAEIKDKIE